MGKRFPPSGVPADIPVVTTQASSDLTNETVLNTTNAQTADIAFAIDNNGSAVTTGIKFETRVDFDCTIESWTLLADQSGSIQLDILKSTYANYPTMASIVAAAPPAISAAQKATSSTLTGWTTTIAAGDVLRFSVASAATITRVSGILKVRKS